MSPLALANREIGRLAPEQRAELRSAWDAFEADNAKALNDFIRIGLHIYLDVQKIPDALIRKEQDPFHQDDRPRLDLYDLV